MPYRAIAFIDGPGLHASLASVGLRETDLDWREVFVRVTPEDHELVRVYWYHVAQVADYDWAPARATRFCPPGVDEAAFIAESRAWHASEQDRIRDRQRTAHRRIVLDYDKIEFRYTGTLNVDPYRRELLGETGLDVGMAVDMVAKMDQFDAAMLVSCDPDLAPAVEVLKEGRKRVYQVTVERGGRGTRSRSTAEGVRVAFDRVVSLTEEDILNEKNRLLRRN
jgi:uncharacterized LabA/DUF88 family protein